MSTASVPSPTTASPSSNEGLFDSFPAYSFTEALLTLRSRCLRKADLLCRGHRDPRELRSVEGTITRIDKYLSVHPSH